MNTTKQNDQDYKALIMVVDDNPEFLNGIELTLEMEGFKVWKATNGQHALDELEAVFQVQMEEELEPACLPDLILADIMMPVMDGYDFYKHIRKNPYLNHIPFIFLTAKDDVTDIRYGKELGSDGYLPKITSAEDLLASIRGKLTRVEQRRAIAAQFTWKPNNQAEGRSVIFNIIIVGLIIIAFWLGFVVSNIFTG